MYNSTGAAVQLRVSGEVDLLPNSVVIPSGYSLMGNMTPVDLDLQSIEVMLNGEKYNSGAQPKVTIQKMLLDGDNTGSYDDDKIYLWKKLGANHGWFKNNTFCTGVNAVTILAGEGFSTYNSSGESVTLKFKAPVAAE